MPELPEVEAIRRQLLPSLVGSRIAAATILKPSLTRGTDPAVLHLPRPGSTVTAIDRRGKLLALRLGNGATILVHLGMDGSLLMESSDAPVGPGHGVLLRLDRGRRLSYLTRRKLGFVRFLSAEASEKRWEGLGPDALDLDATAFSAIAARRRQLKPLLLDQFLLSGLGNILVDESLHRAGLHPLTRGCDLSPRRCETLHGAILEVIGESIAAGGSSIDDHALPDGCPGSFQESHRVYGRKGLPCPACGTPIKRIVVATRGTHFCPRCQRR
jgi:formamidopyrimidine-DNA glycosylase